MWGRRDVPCPEREAWRHSGALPAVFDGSRLPGLPVPRSAMHAPAAAAAPAIAIAPAPAPAIAPAPAPAIATATATATAPAVPEERPLGATAAGGAGWSPQCAARRRGCRGASR
eukprot:scaffold79594_cov75-Phaeocystis_antarctica.AAC.2